LQSSTDSKKLHDVTIKCTVLTATATLTTVAATLLFGSGLPVDHVNRIDEAVNSTCLLLMSSTYHKLYKRLCFCCICCCKSPIHAIERMSTVGSVGSAGSTEASSAGFTQDPHASFEKGVEAQSVYKEAQSVNKDVQSLNIDAQSTNSGGDTPVP